MLTIGLTGGIGSGKSTVAQYFNDLGVTIIDADLIARDLVKKNSVPFNKIIEHFGESVLLADGELNRGKLREIIFTQDSERIWLENLLHPLVLKEINHQRIHVKSLYCILVIPLLLEKDIDYKIDRIVVVDAAEALQIQRVQQRDQITEDHAKAILAKQINRHERLKLAHDVIVNNGNLNNLKLQIETLHQQYLRLSTKK